MAAAAGAPALLEEDAGALIELGAGGCREVIERLLAESPEKALSAGAVLKALGLAPAAAEAAAGAPGDPDIVKLAEDFFMALAPAAAAATVDQLDQLEKVARLLNTYSLHVRCNIQHIKKKASS